MPLKCALMVLNCIYWWILIRSTRPDTRQSSRGRLGRSSNAKKRWQFKNVTDGLTDGFMDGRTDTARCRVACPRLKTRVEPIKDASNHVVHHVSHNVPFLKPMLRQHSICDCCSGILMSEKAKFAQTNGKWSSFTSETSLVSQMR